MPKGVRFINIYICMGFVIGLFHRIIASQLFYEA